MKPGPLTLLYPQWIPGYHGPEGSITLLAGLTFTAAGRPIEWRRNAANMHAFHLQIPNGVETRSRVSIPVPAAVVTGAKGDDTEHCRYAVAYGRAVSGRSALRRHSRARRREVAVKLAIRFIARRRQAGRWSRALPDNDTDRID